MPEVARPLKGTQRPHRPPHSIGVERTVQIESKANEEKSKASGSNEEGVWELLPARNLKMPSKRTTPRDHRTVAEQPANGGFLALQDEDEGEASRKRRKRITTQTKITDNESLCCGRCSGDLCAYSCCRRGIGAYNTA